MAKLTVKGFEELESRLQAIEKGLKGEAEDKMLRAGAKVLIEGWQESIESHGHRVTGAMAGSVGMTDIRRTPDGASIEVYPQGTDSHRINNAQKAYILHYGRNPTKKGTKGIKGDKFVTDAEKRSKERIHAAMQQALDEFIAGKE